jgi:hypothetical protein
MERVKQFLWKTGATWRELIIIGAVIIFIIALIGLAR